MSGICAVWRKEDPARAASTLRSMSHGLSLVSAERIDLKIANGDGVGLAVSARFRTQQVYDNERVVVACDAELYNENELRRLCGTDSGPAAAAILIAALYERFGCDFVSKLSGNFSLVIWDRRERRLFAAVDRFGVDRLVFFENSKVVLIASRIDALLQAGEFVPAVNPRGIANCLNYSNSLAPETIFRDVQRIPPGTWLEISQAGKRSAPYWDMRYGMSDDVDEERLGRRLESLVEKSVETHCKDDAFAEIGAFLSGGTDSSTVVGMMARTRRGPVKAFSIGFEEQQFNELGYAAIASRRFQADHHTYLVSAADCFESLPHMVRSFDEPFGNSSAIPTYFCARLAAQNGVRVLLAGDGGDELFGGNERYRTDKIFHLYQTLPPLLRKCLIEPVLNRMPFENGAVGKARRYVRRSNMPAFERYYSYHFLRASPIDQIFHKDFLDELRGYSILEVPSRYYRDAPASDHLDRLMYLDVKITLGDSDLPKVTQMAELAGVQTRFPLLDTSVAEFSGNIPARLKVKALENRYLFKRAFRNLLPVEVIRKRKHGFGIPVAIWLKSDRRLREFSRDVLFSARALERGYFRRSFLEDLIRKHEADDSSYYGDTLWTFFVLELWHRQFVDQMVGAPA